MVWIISDQQNMGTSDRHTAFRYNPEPTFTSCFLLDSHEINCWWPKWLKNFILKMEKSVPSYPVIILNIDKRKKYNFQILLLGQTLVTELRSMEKYRKELRLSKYRMAHRDEETATAWERLRGAVPRQSVMWLQTPQIYSGPGLYSFAFFSATTLWLQSIRFSWIQHDSKALSKGSLRATLK